MANPCTVQRMVLMAWSISSSAMPYPRSTAAIEARIRADALYNGSSAPLNRAPTVAVYRPGCAAT